MYSSHIARVESLVQEQEEWRSQCVNLIASEQVMSRRARSVMGSDFCHRYAEGHPGERYYQGTDKIDTIESDVKRYLKTLFGCLHTEVRPISGTNANEAVFSRYIRPGDIVLANSTPGGGHISHQRAGTVGKYTRNVISFPLTKDGYHTNVGKTRDLIRAVKPSLVIFGKSLFLFPEPVQDVFEVCGQVGSRVVYDGAHVLGLIAGKQFQNPLKEGADLISASTHKTFPGPQRGLVLSNMDWEEWRRIDKGAFPGSSSNHHLDTLPPLLITTFEMLAFGEAYAAQVIANAKALGGFLSAKGLEVQAKEFGFTQSHQIALERLALRRRRRGQLAPEGELRHPEHESAAVRVAGASRQPRRHPDRDAGDDARRHEGAGDGTDRAAHVRLPGAGQESRRRSPETPQQVPESVLQLRRCGVRLRLGERIPERLAPVDDVVSYSRSKTHKSRPRHPERQPFGRELRAERRRVSYHKGLPARCV